MRFKKVSHLYRRLALGTFIRILLLEITQKIIFKQVRYYFAQEGEDIKILYLLQKYNNGFYLDIGANHPITNSNTFKLYLMGWNGILVDGNKHLIDKAKK